jgi:hypothetical protein
MTPERDEATEKTNTSLIDPAVYAADQASSVVSVIGQGAATILLSVAAGGITFTTSNKIEFVLQHGNLADGSDLAAVTCQRPDRRQPGSRPASPAASSAR